MAGGYHVRSALRITPTTIANGAPLLDATVNLIWNNFFLEKEKNKWRRSKTKITKEWTMNRPQKKIILKKSIKFNYSRYNCLCCSKNKRNFEMSRCRLNLIWSDSLFFSLFFTQLVEIICLHGKLCWLFLVLLEDSQYTNAIFIFESASDLIEFIFPSWLFVLWQPFVSVGWIWDLLLAGKLMKQDIRSQFFPLIDLMCESIIRRASKRTIRFNQGAEHKNHNKK